MTLTALLSITAGLAYIGLGTVRFVVATEAVLLYAQKLGIPHILPEWMPDFGREWFAFVFRWSARLFFLGAAYTRFELAAHSILGRLPAGYGEPLHLTLMALQALGAWVFLIVLTLMANALRSQGDINA